MALGKLKRVANLDPKKWSNKSYLFVKVEGAWSARAEEYLLITNHEYREASKRASRNPEDDPHLKRGVFTRVFNTKMEAAADNYYLAMWVSDTDGKDVELMFTEEEMTRIRDRVDANPEDIEANRESWLADLFD
jgi:hypothetical protein